MYQNLHVHTTLSDGKLTHDQVLDISQQGGVEVVAFNEHDYVPDEKVLSQLEGLRKHPTKWIVGIELSSGWPADLGGGATSNLHIVGLFIDPTNKAIKDHCKHALEARIQRMNTIVTGLQKLGFDITQEDCLKESSGESVGRPHIAAVIMREGHNRAIIEDLKHKMEHESHQNEILGKKYRDMIAAGEKQYPYVLLLGSDSFIPDVYVDYLYYLDFDKSVSLIRNAGGLSILAHWNSCKNKMDESYIDKLFADKRIDGAEVVYGLWTKAAGKWDEQEAELGVIDRLVTKHGLIRSGGGDSHTLLDFKEFASETWFSKRTVGLLDTILAKTNVNKQWSSI